MKSYKYIIVGGGMAGSAAVQGIRGNDPQGTIAMFSEEKYGPYNRPPLTKSLWDNQKIDDIMRPLAKFNIDLFLESLVTQINVEEKWVSTKGEEKFNFQKLLLATGGKPVHFPHSPEGVIHYRTRADFEMLKAMTDSKDRFCVIGGGFIGSEITAALSKIGKDVTMIFPEQGISASLLPKELTEFLNEYYAEKGVKVLSGYLVEEIIKTGDNYEVHYKKLASEEIISQTFDGVVVGIGIKPNLDLAANAGLKVSDGILVNELLQTNDPNIFAAGDVSNFFNFGLGKRVRVEHEDNANAMGLIAGQNMSGEPKKYDHFPFFYSDLFDLGYEAVGEINPNLQTYSDWIDPFRKGTIYYLEDGKIRGLIFWNLWGKIDEGRKVISSGQTYHPSELAGFFSE